MADDADRADRLIENHLRLALSQRSKDTLPRTGFCHSCEAEVQPEALFCDGDCKDDYERAARAQSRNGVADA